MYLDISDVESKFKLTTKRPKLNNKIIATQLSGSTPERTYFSEICSKGAKGAIACTLKSGEVGYVREFEASCFEKNISWGTGGSVTKGYIRSKGAVYEIERELTPRLFAKAIIDASAMHTKKHGTRTVPNGDALLLAFDRTETGSDVYLYHSTKDKITISKHYLSQSNRTKFDTTKKLLLTLNKYSKKITDFENFQENDLFSKLSKKPLFLKKPENMGHKDFFRTIIIKISAPIDANVEEFQEKKIPFYFGGYDLSSANIFEFDFIIRGYKTTEEVVFL
ncbi:hypothetical protein [Photobacterium kishitanii]|uniref:Uncharacterized protein n=1 Tax=Photobacterium kishitanii TaxID=318456 RepID=A0A2T3KLU5_9GAMM|nr:hypothetical protein [Photobacterium kishitanii]PSV00685.1 hypothetical protein C9J27_05970 [Photobacterium kishitanii]